jgi:hypothetical protein
MSRVDRREHIRMGQDVADTEHRNHCEPQQHQGSEYIADARCPAALDGKEAEQDSNCRRHDGVGLEHRGRGVDALERAQDREPESARSTIRTLGQRARICWTMRATSSTDPAEASIFDRRSVAAQQFSQSPSPDAPTPREKIRANLTRPIFSSRERRSADRERRRRPIQNQSVTGKVLPSRDFGSSIEGFIS